MEWLLPAALVVLLAVVLIGVVQLQNSLERTRRKVDALLRHFAIDPASPPPSERVKELARDPARKIEAIKAYRAETGAGLAEAKEAVEAFINSR